MHFIVVKYKLFKLYWERFLKNHSYFNSIIIAIHLWNMFNLRQSLNSNIKFQMFISTIACKC